MKQPSTPKVTQPPKPFSVLCTVTTKNRDKPYRHRVGTYDTLTEAREAIGNDREHFKVNPRDTLQQLIGPPPEGLREYAIFEAHWTLIETD